MADYVLNGFKWGSDATGTTGGVVTWSFAVGGGQLYKLNVANDPQFSNTIRAAFQAWEDVASIDFVEVADSTSVDLRIGYEPIDGPYGQGGEAQYMTRTHQMGVTEKKAEIRIDSLDTWTHERIFAMVVHEIGHAIGLGHSTNSASIMLPILSSSHTGLASMDIAGAQLLYGPSQTGSSPLIRGGAGADTLNGTTGNDIFVASGGDDSIHGNGGHDVVRFAGGRADYNAYMSGAAVVVNDVRGGQPDGNNILHDISRIEFSDGVVAFDINGIAGKAYRLYQAALDRTPDTGGLGFWIKEFDAGRHTLTSAAQAFLFSPEFQQTFGTAATVSNAQYIDLLYNNVLKRSADSGGTAFWNDKLQTGWSRADVLEYFSESTENQGNVYQAVKDGIWFA